MIIWDSEEEKEKVKGGVGVRDQNEPSSSSLGSQTIDEIQASSTSLLGGVIVGVCTVCDP